MDVDKKSLGKRIKSIRIKYGLTQKEFGKLFENKEKNENKANKGIVSAWERGASVPSPERLKKIAELGEMSVDELLYGSIPDYISNVIHTSKSNKIIDTTIINAVVNYYMDGGISPYSDDERINELYNNLLGILSEIDYEEIEIDNFENIEMYDLSVLLKRLKDEISEMIYFEELPKDERTASVLNSIDDISRLLIELDNDFSKNEQRM